MAFVRDPQHAVRDKKIGKRVVPIVPDESRTFGMEGMFRQLGIYSPGRPALQAGGRRPAHVLQGGQERPDPAGGHQRAGRDVVVDRGGDVVQHQRRADDPVLHLLLDVRLPARRRPGLGRGRHRARAASCSAAPPGAPRSTAKACSTRTATATCSSATIPNCVSYDPTFAYEVAVIIQDGLRRMFAEQEDVFYYITVMNENYAHPAMPEGARGRDPQGACTCSARAARRSRRQRPRVQLLGSGTILREVIAAAELLEQTTSASPPTSGAARASPSCAATAMDVERWNLLHPTSRRALSYVEQCLAEPRRAGDRRDRLHAGVRRPDPRVRAAAALHRARHRRLRPLGLPQASCADFFEVDRHYVAVAALKALAEDGARRRPTTVAEAIKQYGIDPDKPDPGTPEPDSTRPRGPRRRPRATEVAVPDIGDFKDVPVIEVLVQPGRHGQRRGSAGHAGVRQGDDGGAGPVAGTVTEVRSSRRPRSARTP